MPSLTPQTSTPAAAAPTPPHLEVAVADVLPVHVHHGLCAVDGGVQHSGQVGRAVCHSVGSCRAVFQVWKSGCVDRFGVLCASVGSTRRRAVRHAAGACGHRASSVEV
eukprot:65839-Chlamydomonas_euryale.AAC.3